MKYPDIHIVTNPIKLLNINSDNVFNFSKSCIFKNLLIPNTIIVIINNIIVITISSLYFFIFFSYFACMIYLIT